MPYNCSVQQNCAIIDAEITSQRDKNKKSGLRSGSLMFLPRCHVISTSIIAQTMLKWISIEYVSQI